jgi:hypothetical protein
MTQRSPLVRLCPEGCLTPATPENESWPADQSRPLVTQKLWRRRIVNLHQNRVGPSAGTLQKLRPQLDPRAGAVSFGQRKTRRLGRVFVCHCADGGAICTGTKEAIASWTISSAYSILRQDVDFTKLLLKLLDSLDAIGVSFSETLGRDGRPAPIAWYNRNRD